MNIKRFVASDMREGLKAVREALGEDAVILSNRRIDGGVEIIAAVDYSAPLADDVAALSPAALRALAEEGSARPATAWSAAATAYDAGAFAPRAAEPAADTTEALKEELRGLRRLLESQLASLAWSDFDRRLPERTHMLREMSRFGIDPELTRELLREVPESYDSREGMRALVKLFGERLPLVDTDLTDGGGVFALIGPTGVGKTTTIAKLAARFILRHSAAELGLVSTDVYRIGARQQLLTFARIMGVPMQVANGADELARVLDGLAGKKLVLIDTAGVGQRDARLAAELAALAVERHAVTPVLALSAAADAACLEEAAAAFGAAEPRALILTKLDEAARLGPVLSLAVQRRLPIAYVTDGQRVPEDLHTAAPKRFWLLQRAIRLAVDRGAQADESELADRVGYLELAAHG